MSNGSDVEILSQCSTEGKDICSNSVNELPMISIVNSSDVIIGSVTQFHGPVTIVQHVPSKEGIEDKKNEADMVATEYKTKLPTKNSASPAGCLPKRLLICFAILAVLIVLIVLSLIFLIEKRYEDDISTLDTVPVTKYNFSDHHFYTIEDWGGIRFSYTFPVSKPILYVVICHTAGVFCDNFSKCSEQVRIAQDMHVNKGLHDISYNFLIGGDGAIYEGRGWHTRNVIRDYSISISFIGNFIRNELNSSMEDALLELLNNGLANNELPADYKIVAHNQTVATESPGRNVYKVIEKYPNFYPDRLPQARN